MEPCRFLTSKEFTNAKTKKEMEKLILELKSHVLKIEYDGADKLEDALACDMYLDNGQIIMMRETYCNVRTILTASVINTLNN